MRYWMLILFWLLVLAVALIGYFTNGIVEYILEVVTYIMGIFGMWVCANEALFLLKLRFLEKGVSVKDKFEIRVIDILSLFISVGIAVGYGFSGKNWILNDVLCLCLVIASIKIFKFTNLKIALVGLICTLAI